ncbi:hypothetical protein [Pseudomonas sp. QTF5]|uniref:hypothetical protein n=1 Tax=Pseudomonas sp. QTF5 TaxID=1435425 RepID=UPI0004B9D4A5|nr:hypothetical protein [Pseudomonas sp. QTF5]
MFAPANQTHFALTIEGADADKAGAVLTPAQINTLKRNAPLCEECEKYKAGACAI